MIDKWKKTLLGPNQTIREGLEILERGAEHIALIVDAEMTLLGLITDGDVRRAILRGMTLENPVSAIMNPAPIVVASSAARADAVRVMEQHQVLAVPILAGKTVVGLETLLKDTGQRKYANAVFLMAGGFGTRLRPLTDDCPKPMLKVGEKPILENVLNSFISAGFFNFYISLHYLPEVVMDYFGDGSKWDVNIHYIHETKPLGTGGALGLLPNNIADAPVLVSNGDLLTQVDFELLIKFHEKHRAEATMCVRDHTYQVPFGVVTGDGNSISGIVEKPTYRHFVNAGIYVVNRDLVRHVRKNEKIHMPDLFEKLIEQKKRVLMFPLHEYWLDIGQIDDFKRAQQDILSMRF